MNPMKDLIQAGLRAPGLHWPRPGVGASQIQYDEGRPAATEKYHESSDPSQRKAPARVSPAGACCRSKSVTRPPALPIPG